MSQTQHATPPVPDELQEAFRLAENFASQFNGAIPAHFSTPTITSRHGQPRVHVVVDEQHVANIPRQFTIHAQDITWVILLKDPIRAQTLQRVINSAKEKARVFGYPVRFAPELPSRKNPNCRLEVDPEGNTTVLAFRNLTSQQAAELGTEIRKFVPGYVDLVYRYIVLPIRTDRSGQITRLLVKKLSDRKR